MPWPGTTSSRSTRSAKVAWPLARSCATTCSLVCPGGELLADHPGEDDVGGPAEDQRADHAQQMPTVGQGDADDQDQALGRQMAEQPLERRAEVQRLLGRDRGAREPGDLRRLVLRPFRRLVQDPSTSGRREPFDSATPGSAVRSLMRGLLRAQLGVDDLGVGRTGWRAARRGCRCRRSRRAPAPRSGRRRRWWPPAGRR